MSDEEDEDAEAADGKKRKKGANKDGADGKDAKRKKPEVDKRDKQRLANMFAKNAAAVAAGGLKRAPMADAAGAKPAQDADSLLEDILGDIGTSVGDGRSATRQARQRVQAPGAPYGPASQRAGHPRDAHEAVHGDPDGAQGCVRARREAHPAGGDLG
jgi:hypothetical protein